MSVYTIQNIIKKSRIKETTEFDKLNQQVNFGKGLLDSYGIKLDIVKDLERMSFGINELRILYDTLMKIGRENINNTNNKTFEQIKKEFFDDLKNYGEILRSRKERDRLKNEIKNLCIVKLHGAAGGKGYFLAWNEQSFDEGCQKLIDQKVIKSEKELYIQEYVLGVQIF